MTIGHSLFRAACLAAFLTACMAYAPRDITDTNHRTGETAVVGLRSTLE